MRESEYLDLRTVAAWKARPCNLRLVCDDPGNCFAMFAPDVKGFDRRRESAIQSAFQIRLALELDAKRHDRPVNIREASAASSSGCVYAFCDDDQSSDSEEGGRCS